MTRPRHQKKQGHIKNTVFERATPMGRAQDGNFLETAISTNSLGRETGRSRMEQKKSQRLQENTRQRRKRLLHLANIRLEKANNTNDIERLLHLAGFRLSLDDRAAKLINSYCERMDPREVSAATFVTIRNVAFSPMVKFFFSSDQPLWGAAHYRRVRHLELFVGLFVIERVIRSVNWQNPPPVEYLSKRQTYRSWMSGLGFFSDFGFDAYYFDRNIGNNHLASFLTEETILLSGIVDKVENILDGVENLPYLHLSKTLISFVVRYFRLLCSNAGRSCDPSEAIPTPTKGHLGNKSKRAHLHWETIPGLRLNCADIYYDSFGVASHSSDMDDDEQECPLYVPSVDDETFSTPMDDVKESPSGEVHQLSDLREACHDLEVILGEEEEPREPYCASSSSSSSCRHRVMGDDSLMHLGDHEDSPETSLQGTNDEVKRSTRLELEYQSTQSDEFHEEIMTNGEDSSFDFVDYEGANPSKLDIDEDDRGAAWELLSDVASLRSFPTDTSCDGSSSVYAHPSRSFKEALLSSVPEDGIALESKPANKVPRVIRLGPQGTTE